MFVLMVAYRNILAYHSTFIERDKQGILGLLSLKRPRFLRNGTCIESPFDVDILMFT